ncbi:IS630 family transposase [Streptomyces adelaidensis]|uniref:IS630 family transposase n=1 Tax=Streptomyces adelaidensis TaxID=2796465 RepID=UPI0035563392
MGKYLRRWGLSFQRPDKRAVEQDAEAVRVRREETWPAIRAKARAEGGEVLFADQAGIRSDQVTGRTWGAKGCTPIVRRTGNRFSVNAMSAISTKGRMHFMVLTETFDADVMCRFLNRLAGHYDRKVHLVLDGHSAHRSRKIRAWPARRRGGPGGSGVAGPLRRLRSAAAVRDGHDRVAIPAAQGRPRVPVHRAPAHRAVDAVPVDDRSGQPGPIGRRRDGS